MKTLNIDPGKCKKENIGISYSAGSERGVIHLGVMKAFIDLGVKPHYIVGVSAGSVAAALHASDPDSFKAIELATAAAKKLKPADFGFSLPQIVLRVLSQRTRLQSIGHLSGFRKILEEHFPIKEFSEAKVPFAIEATNRLNGQQIWFEEGSVIDAIIASSSLPVAFPPTSLQQQLYVDGGVSDALPLFRLAQKGCGTIFSVNLGYAGEIRKPPKNLLENLIGSLDITQYQSNRYEIALISALFPSLTIVEIRPDIAFDLPPFGFTTEKISPIVQEAFEKAKEVIKKEVSANASISVSLNGDKGKQT